MQYVLDYNPFESKCGAAQGSSKLIFNLQIFHFLHILTVFKLQFRGYFIEDFVMLGLVFRNF